MHVQHTLASFRYGAAGVLHDADVILSLIISYCYSRRRQLRSKAFSGVCVSVILCLSVCLSVCLHDKTKMAETKITKHVAGIVHHESSLTN